VCNFVYASPTRREPLGYPLRVDTCGYHSRNERRHAPRPNRAITVRA